MTRTEPKKSYQTNTIENPPEVGWGTGGECGVSLKGETWQKKNERNGNGLTRKGQIGWRVGLTEVKGDLNTDQGLKEGFRRKKEKRRLGTE